MEYPWPPLQAPGYINPNIRRNSQFPNPNLLNSQFHYPNNQFQNPNFPHSQFSNNLYQNNIQNPNLPSHLLPIQNPNFHLQIPNQNPNLHIQNPNSNIRNSNLQIQNPNFNIQNPNLHVQNPNLNIENPNLQIQNPNFNIQNPNSQIQNPNLNIQNPNLQIQNPNFNIQNPNLHVQNPNLNIQNPNLQIQNPNFNIQNPNFQIRNPNFESYGQNPNLPAQFENPNLHSQFDFQSHQNPNFQNKNPNLHIQNPNLQSDFAPNRNPNFESPNLKHQFENPNKQAHIYQNPNFHHSSAIKNPYDIQNLNFNKLDIALDRKPEIQNPNFQAPQIPLHQNPNFDRNLKRPMPEGISRIVHDHGGNYSILANRILHNSEIRRHIDEDRMLHDSETRRRIDEDRLIHKSEIRRHFDEIRMFHQREIERHLGKNSILPFSENRMLHERSNLSENRALMLHDDEIRRNIGENQSLMLHDRDIREEFGENSGLKRPIYDDLDMPKRYEIKNIRDDRLNGIRPKNNFFPVRDNRLNEIDTSLDNDYSDGKIEIRKRDYYFTDNPDWGRFANPVLPMPLEISPRKRSYFENEKNVLRDRKRPHFDDRDVAKKALSLFPIAVDKSPPLASSYASFSEKPLVHASSGFASKELSMNHSREGQRFSLINKPKDVNATHIFKQPHRATRPDHIVVILRGLPGSGKSYLAKMMRDLEVENGGSAPRIHTMDDYFMTEVEKVGESDNLKSSGSSKGKKPAVKMVMEYCYEAEMEEAYRSSMLKTFKKTLDEGAFPFVIVDDRNLRVADFAQFWATAKRSGYEVYLLEATYKDPAGCAARNIHGFSLDDIRKMADQWEEAPPMYLKLDAKSLSQTDNLKENEIQEVDMDTDDGESEDVPCVSVERKFDVSAPVTGELSPSGGSKAEGSWNAESDHLKEEVKELGRSKWSSDLEDDDADRKVDSKGNPNALSAIVKAYKRDGKSVHWGDQAANTGFSIGAAKRLKTSLVIGPGSGYNSKSYLLPEDLVSSGNSGTLKTQSVFKERIRAEHESFRAVFDKRRHRIGGLDSDEE